MLRTPVTASVVGFLRSGNRVSAGENRYTAIRCLSTTNPGLGSMKAWVLNEYDSYSSMILDKTQEIPTIRPDEMLVKVSAASVNPLDVEMAKGYGSRLLNSLRSVQGIQEFPLILGRDCSGTVVQRGRKVRRFEVGEKVWCARWVTGPGTHAQYVAVKVNEASRKPANLSHAEAASLPFVACTAWASLVSRGGLTSKNPGKRVLILGGSGGIGTFSIQLSKYMGATVTSTCRGDFTNLLKTIGADNVLDYREPSHLEALKDSKPFDIIMDCRGGQQDDQYRCYLAHDPSASYISLMSPILPSTDTSGLTVGMISSAAQFLNANKNVLVGKGLYSWGFYFPSAGVLEQVKKLVEKGYISPVLDSLYSFSEANLAYEHFSHGNLNGKVVISVE